MYYLKLGLVVLTALLLLGFTALSLLFFLDDSFRNSLGLGNYSIFVVVAVLGSGLCLKLGSELPDA